VIPISCEYLLAAIQPDRRGSILRKECKTYHLEPLLHGGSTLEVSGGGRDVPVHGLLGQIDHVAGEEGLAVELEVALILIQHAIEPGEELLGAVVGVEDNGDAVGGSNGADVVSSGDGTGNGGGLAVIADTLAGEVSSTTLGDLQADGGLSVASGLEGSDDGGGGGDVLKNGELLLLCYSCCCCCCCCGFRVDDDGRKIERYCHHGRWITYDGGDSKLLLLSVLEETEDVVTDDDTGLAAQLLSDTHID
jgi:hypothetical protein